MAIDTTSTTTIISRLCQSPSVWLSGITPLMARIDGGSELGAAMMSAADDDKPERPDAAVPRYAAAPTAR